MSTMDTDVQTELYRDWMSCLPKVISYIMK